MKEFVDGEDYIILLTPSDLNLDGVDYIISEKSLPNALTHFKCTDIKKVQNASMIVFKTDGKYKLLKTRELGNYREKLRRLEVMELKLMNLNKLINKI